MRNYRAQPGIPGKGKNGSFRYTIYSKHHCFWVSLHTAVAYEQFCKQIDKLSFLRLQNPDSSKAQICFFLNAFWKSSELSGMVLIALFKSKNGKRMQDISSTIRLIFESIIFSSMKHANDTRLTQYSSIFNQ